MYNAGDFPSRIEIELAAACNLRCVYCPRRFMDGLNGFMEIPLFKKIVNEASERPSTILVLHRRGESLLHPEFKKMCAYVAGKFSQVQLATNATLLDEDASLAIIKTVSFVSFSIDAPEAFDKIRVPASYSKVEANILKFLKLNNDKVLTQVSMVRRQDTSNADIEKFKRMWKGKVNRIRIYEEHSQSGKFGSLGRPRGRRSPCTMLFYSMLVYYDGMTGRCNHDWNGAALGDLNKQSLKEIWNSCVYEDLRRQHESLRITDSVCRDCDSWYPFAGRQETGEAVE